MILIFFLDSSLSAGLQHHLMSDITDHWISLRTQSHGYGLWIYFSFGIWIEFRVINWNQLTIEWIHRFTSSLLYYGLSFQAQDIGTNIYVTFGWLALAEIPSILLSTYAMQVFGRKKVLCFLLIFGGIACIAPVFLTESYRSYLTVFAVLGKSLIAAAFSLIYVYSVEIFPTVLRSSGLGMCSMCSRIGGILAPHLIELVIWVFIDFWLIFGLIFVFFLSVSIW